MKFYQPILVLAPLLLIAGLSGETRAEPLPQSTPCETALESSTSQRIFDLKLELGRTNALSRDEFSSIRRSLDALMGVGTSPAAKKCFAQYPVQRQRYRIWLARHAGEIIKQALSRLNRTCSRRADMFIRTHRNRIDAAIGAKRLAKASKLADKMREGIINDSMIVNCEAVKSRLGIILNDYLPSIRNQAALPKVMGKMSSAYFGAFETVEASMAALQTSGRSMAPAPRALESAEGRAELNRQLSQCTSYAVALGELGAGPKTVLFSPSGATAKLGVAERWCAGAATGVDVTATRVSAHNESYRQAVLARWLRTNIKTWSMEKVYNSRGRPVAESTTADGSILWTYKGDAGQCVRIRFTSRGKKTGEQPLSCPVLTSK
ncbi:MAG: hypothetical protein GY811_16730 [Myxococcales bacterium]|nr:hypothetical protein [Myxococcales bacterium]